MALAAKTSYITLADAETYFAGKLECEPWTNSDTNQKRRALVEASTILDQFNYCGTKAVNTQEHEFPRLQALPTYDQNRYDTDLVPFDIKYATAEMAMALLNGWDRNIEIEDANIKKEAFGSVHSEKDVTVVSQRVVAGVPPSVWNFILPYLRDSRSARLLRV